MLVLDFVVIFGFLLLSDITVSIFGIVHHCRKKGQNRCCVNYWMINGRCEACPSGLYGLNCSLECPEGYHGKLCKKKCICAPTAICLPATGCDCSSPPVLENAKSLYSTTSPGSKAVYNCNKGYVYNGIAVDDISCLENGIWESPAITCQRIEYGSSAIYICQIGYTQFGNDKIKCLENSTWEQPSGCHLIDCGLPPNVSNAVTTYNSTTYGSHALITCDKSLSVGIYTVTCSANGKWNAHQLLNCSPERGVTVAMVFIVVIVSILMIFRQRLQSFSRRYIGAAYTTGISKCAENATYTDLREYYEIGNIPDENPLTLQLPDDRVGTLRLHSIPTSESDV